eukprot:UN4678
MSRYLQAHEIHQGMWRPNQLTSGDIVGLLATTDGNLMLFVNEDTRAAGDFAQTGSGWTWTSLCSTPLDDFLLRSCDTLSRAPTSLGRSRSVL